MNHALNQTQLCSRQHYPLHFPHRDTSFSLSQRRRIKIVVLSLSRHRPVFAAVYLSLHRPISRFVFFLGHLIL
ncbi:hypothetical protein Hanom_Chr06g00529521 [Helianthus anomalus]